MQMQHESIPEIIETMMGGMPHEPPGPSESELKSQEDDRQRKLQKVWLARIEAEERDHKEYREHVDTVMEVYNNDLGNSDTLFVPLLWTTTQIQNSGIYSNTPVVDVRPRNDENNPIFKTASDVLERGISFFVDDKAFSDSFHRVVDDYLVSGLGVVRVKVDSEITEIPSQLDEYGEEGEPEEAIGNQSVRWEYVPWRRFGWEPGNNWHHTDWVYFRHRMTQAQIRKRFGKTVKASKDKTDKRSINSANSRTFDVYEVWDKQAKKVLFIGKGESKPIEVSDDPLGLSGFFPMPPPLFTNLPSEELIPRPDYDYIVAYDVELNRLQQRRMGVLEQLRVSGAYDQGLPELGDILELEDGEMKPIQNLLARLKGQGFDNAIFFLPLEEKIRTLDKLTEQIAFVMQQVERVLGIADIVQGSSNVNEGVGTQALKSRWAGVRLARKRNDVQYTLREMMRIMGQVLTSHFTDENLSRLTQVQINPEVFQLLRSDLMSDFAIDIETESTIAPDMDQERQNRAEMMQSLIGYAQSVLPAVQQGQLPADVSSGILRAAMKPYTQNDRSLDESLNSLQTSQQQLQQINTQLQQTQQQLQQSQQTATQWQQLAQQLQFQATEASSQQKQADAGKKQAETEKIRAGMRDELMQPAKTAGEIEKTKAEVFDIYRGK